LPLLLLHGLTYSTMAVFDLAVPGRARAEYSLLLRLAGLGIETYALDFPGHGLSSADPDGTEDITNGVKVGHQVRSVATALRWIGEQHSVRPVLLGWSWGAKVAARCANQYPDLLSGLIYWSPYWPTVATGSPTEVRPVSGRTGRRVNTVEDAASGFVTPGAFEPVVRDAFIQRALQVDPTSPVIVDRTSPRLNPPFDPRHLPMPVLLVQGANEPWKSGRVRDFEEGKVLSSLPNAASRRVVIPNSDHNIQFGFARHQFDRVILEFILRLVSEPA
jgi:pimeloyl-ACP methyl ester carboxylesterase